jgi:methyl-accepting chemotaxis protein
MERLAGGDTGTDIPATHQSDEIGAMARAVEVFKQALIANKEAEARAKDEAMAKVRRAGEVEALTQAFERDVDAVIGALGAASAKMEETARSMTSIAEQTSVESAHLASADEHTSSNVQAVAAATEEVSASIRDIARQVAQSSTIAAKAVEGAKRTDQIVQGSQQAPARSARSSPSSKASPPKPIFSR